MLEIRSPIATKQLSLAYDKAQNKYFLDVIAYGTWWTRVFNAKYSLLKYLKKEWHLDKDQVQQLFKELEL
jgi:hypothetical protein